MSKPDTLAIQGCTDGGCIFGHPGGMHTNGGCQCVKEMRGEIGRRTQRNIRLLRQKIQRLQDEREELRHALEHINTCPDTKLCPGCGKLAGESTGRKMVGGYQETSEGRKWLLDDPGKP